MPIGSTKSLTQASTSLLDILQQTAPQNESQTAPQDRTYTQPETAENTSQPTISDGQENGQTAGQTDTQTAPQAQPVKRKPGRPKGGKGGPGRPKGSLNKSSIRHDNRVIVLLNDNLAKMLDETAAKRNCGRGKIIREALTKYLLQ